MLVPMLILNEEHFEELCVKAEQLFEDGWKEDGPVIHIAGRYSQTFIKESNDCNR